MKSLNNFQSNNLWVDDQNVEETPGLIRLKSLRIPNPVVKLLSDLESTAFGWETQDVVNLLMVIYY